MMASWAALAASAFIGFSFEVVKGRFIGVLSMVSAHRGFQYWQFFLYDGSIYTCSPAHPFSVPPLVPALESWQPERTVLGQTGIARPRHPMNPGCEASERFRLPRLSRCRRYRFRLRFGFSVRRGYRIAVRCQTRSYTDSLAYSCQSPAGCSGPVTCCHRCPARTPCNSATPSPGRMLPDTPYPCRPNRDFQDDQ